MNAADIVLVIVIGAALAAAVTYLVRRKKSGTGCCGDCSRCSPNECRNKKSRS
ncbi:MAG: FeoB-associated Cys-rich membrane protein [Ruminococcus sp.]|nr:FeoB-associated Cys-rich membrane protein [Ruminococcus sp.]